MKYVFALVTFLAITIAACSNKELPAESQIKGYLAAKDFNTFVGLYVSLNDGKYDPSKLASVAYGIEYEHGDPFSKREAEDKIKKIAEEESTKLKGQYNVMVSGSWLGLQEYNFERKGFEIKNLLKLEPEKDLEKKFSGRQKLVLPGRFQIDVNDETIARSIQKPARTLSPEDLKANIYCRATKAEIKHEIFSAIALTCEPTKIHIKLGDQDFGIFDVSEIK